MPAVNPRITITIKPEVAAILRRLSELTGNSQSAMVGELLGESLPLFERMVEVLEASQKLRAQAMAAPSELTESLERAQARLEAQLGLALEEMDEATRPLLDAAERVPRRGARRAPKPAPRAPRRGAKTPPSNRGVRSDLRQTKQPLSRKGAKR